ncbi:MAG: 50S ribosomal protein L21 [Rhizobiaceae bacterium]
MFAVIKTGGKQYNVAADDLLKIEKLAGNTGDMIEFTEVLMVGEGADTTIGCPTIDGAMVVAEIIDQGRARKVIAFKKRRRQNSRRTIGHRQHFTQVRISEILTDGAKPSKKAAAKKPAAKKAEPKKEAAPAKTETVDAPAKKAAPAKPAPAKKAEKSSDALFTTPKGDPDDLKKISGVGPALEKKLHAFGVTKFEQVAAFSKADIEKLDDALSFKGRIERDGWLGQAAQFAKEV